MTGIEFDVLDKHQAEGLRRVTEILERDWRVFEMVNNLLDTTQKCGHCKMPLRLAKVGVSDADPRLELAFEHPCKDEQSSKCYWKYAARIDRRTVGDWPDPKLLARDRRVFEYLNRFMLDNRECKWCGRLFRLSFVSADYAFIRAVFIHVDDEELPGQQERAKCINNPMCTIERRRLPA